MSSGVTATSGCSQLVDRGSLIPPRARGIWAKSGEGAGHGLLAHMLDVAAVAETIMDMEPVSILQWVTTQMGIPAEHAKR